MIDASNPTVNNITRARIITLKDKESLGCRYRELDDEIPVLRDLKTLRPSHQIKFIRRQEDYNNLNKVWITHTMLDK